MGERSHVGMYVTLHTPAHGVQHLELGPLEESIMHMTAYVHILYIEAMMCIWRVLGPLEEGPVELQRDCGCSLRRNFQQQLHHVRSLSIFCWLIVLIKCGS